MTRLGRRKNSPQILFRLPNVFTHNLAQVHAIKVASQFFRQHLRRRRFFFAFRRGEQHADQREPMGSACCSPLRKAKKKQRRRKCWRKNWEETFIAWT